MGFPLKTWDKKTGKWEIVTGAFGVDQLNDLSDVVITGTPADNEVVAYDTATGKFINQVPAAGGNSFETINTPAGTNPVAESATDTLNLTSNTAALTITGDSATDTVAFALVLSGIAATLITGAAGTDGVVTAFNANGDITGTSPAFPPKFNDTSSDHRYIIGVAELAADRTISFPLLTGNDTFTFNDFAALLKNKQLEDSTTSIVDDADNTKVLKFQLVAATTGRTMTLSCVQTANRTLTLPDATDTLVAKATTDTLTNKTIDQDGAGNSITNIANASIKAAAAIALNKLAALTASEIVITDGSGFMVSAAVATYPSLAELIHLKGVTSAIQTQIDAVEKMGGTCEIQNPSVGDAFLIKRRTYRAYTISEVSGETDPTGTSATFNIEQRAYGSRPAAGTDVLTADLVGIFGGAANSTFADATVDDDDYLVVTVSATSATPPDLLTVNFEGTYD